MTEDMKPDLSGIFRQMADKMDLNSDNGFAGAFVIVPPQGEARELLLLNNTGDPAMFWGLLKTTADIALSDLAEAAQGATGWPQQRR